MSKMNCWEIKKCGREKGGSRAKELGVCPASTDTSCNGINKGKNAGRICWIISNTFCDGKNQIDFAQKQVYCLSCEVFKRVREEEGQIDFTLLKSLRNHQPGD